MEQKIGGLSIERWKSAFAEAVNIAIEKDYFSDILFYDLYEDYDHQIEYKEMWKYTNEAFEAIFGYNRHNY